MVQKESPAELAFLAWKETCTVPEYPDSCPDCGSTVVIFHLNLAGDAIFTCRNKKCDWPLKSLPKEKFSGFSDLKLYTKWQEELKAERKQKKRDKKERKKKDGKSGSDPETSQILPTNILDKSSEQHDETPPQVHHEEEPSIEDVQRNKPKPSEEQKKSLPLSTLQDQTEPDTRVTKEKEVLTGHQDTFIPPGPSQTWKKSTNSKPSRCIAELDSDDNLSDVDDILRFSKVPQMMSPFPRSPRTMAPSPQYNTEFRRPTPKHLPASPLSLNRTPVHVPCLLEPLSLTPKRISDSDTDTFSDASYTPRADRMKDVSDSMFDSSDQNESMPIITLKKSSKDLWSVNQQSSSSSSSKPTSSSEARTTPKSLRKSQGKQSVSLDTRERVVLSLKKKSEGKDGNVSWNVTDKQPIETKGATENEFDHHKDEKTPLRGIPDPSTKQSKNESCNDSESCNDTLVLPSMSTESNDSESQVDKQSSHQASRLRQEGSKAGYKRKRVQTSNEDFPARKIEHKVPNSPGLKLGSLSNRLSMHMGLPITVAVKVKEDPQSTSKKTDECAKNLKNLLMGYQTRDFENQEFRSLMKNSSECNDLEFMKRLQDVLLKQKGNSVVSLHVGQKKPSIDLPGENTFAVSDSAEHVQMLMSSDSDGIEGEVLKSSNYKLDFGPSCHIRKRGRPKKPSPCSSPIGQEKVSAEPLPYRFDIDLGGELQLPRSLDGRLEFPESDLKSISSHMEKHNYNNFFAVPENLTAFQNFIDESLKGFFFSNTLSNSGIDPVIAMLFSKLNDTVNTERYAFYQTVMEMYAAYQSLMARVSSTEEPVNLTNPLQINGIYNDHSSDKPAEREDNPVFTELQPRKSNDIQTPNSIRRNVAASAKSPDTSCQRSDDPLPIPSVERVKVETIEFPSSPQTNSVVLSSVLPAEKSVQAISKNMPASGKIGTGNIFVTATYENCSIGPIQVSTEIEAQVLKALIQDRVTAMEDRGKKLAEISRTYNALALRAKTILDPEVVKYVEKAFTRNGLKEHIVGRKKRNYPKRSQIIKVDPETGELIHPTQKVNNLKDIKKEVEQDDAEEQSRTETTNLYNANLTNGPSLLAPSVQSHIQDMLDTSRKNNEEAQQRMTESTGNSIDLDPRECDITRVTFQDVWSSNNDTIETKRRQHSSKGTKKHSTRSRTNNKRHLLSTGQHEASIKEQSCSQENSRDCSSSTVPEERFYRGYQPRPKLSVNGCQTSSEKIPGTNSHDMPQLVSTQDSNPKLAVVPSKSKANTKLSNGTNKKAKLKSHNEAINEENDEFEPNDCIDLGVLPDIMKKANEDDSESRIRTRQDTKESFSLKGLSNKTAKLSETHPASSLSNLAHSSLFYVRSNQASRIKILLKKREQKKKYKAFETKKGKNEAKSKQPDMKPSKVSKFKPAEVIGGVKRILKPNGEVVEEVVGSQRLIDEANCNNQKSLSKSKHIAAIKKEEKELLDQLLTIAHDVPDMQESSDCLNNFDESAFILGASSSTDFSDLF